MAKSVHVTPHKDGGWQVKTAGATKAAKRTSTQQEGISHAKEQAKNNKAELYIHNKHGHIRYKNSYGNDPFPPRG